MDQLVAKPRSRQSLLRESWAAPWAAGSVVLGLDQAPRCTGFAYGPSTFGFPPSFGHQLFASYGENEQFLILDYSDWLSDLLDKVEPRHVIFEQIVINMKHPNIASFYQQAAVIEVIMYQTAIRAITASQVDISVWRKRALGKSNKPKWAHLAHDGWLKDAAKASCLERNWLPKTHDEAEAMLIWDYGCAERDVAYMSATKPHVARVLLERENADRAFHGK